MSAPIQKCQPKGVEYLRWLASPDAEPMSEYWRINEFVRSGLEAADRIEELEAAMREFVAAYKLQDCDNYTEELARAYSIADAALSGGVARAVRKP